MQQSDTSRGGSAMKNKKMQNEAKKRLVCQSRNSLSNNNYQPLPHQFSLPPPIENEPIF
jgi:hypothetical protein